MTLKSEDLRFEDYEAYWEFIQNGQLQYVMKECIERLLRTLQELASQQRITYDFEIEKIIRDFSEALQRVSEHSVILQGETEALIATFASCFSIEPQKHETQISLYTFFPERMLPIYTFLRTIPKVEITR